MATPRQTIAAQIKADHPDFVVMDYPYVPTNVQPGKPVVSVWRAKVSPQSTNKAQGLRHDLTIQAYGAKLTDAAGRESELDDLLDDVLLSVTRAGVNWSDAVRETFAGESLHGWVISLQGASANVYREICLAELEKTSTPESETPE